jgi:hypothetical protein
MGSFSKRYMTAKQLFAHEDTSLPRKLFFFFTRFTVADAGYVWLFIKGHINQRCGEPPI